MIVLVSLIVLLRELLVSTIFRMVHPYIAIHSIFTLVCIYLSQELILLYCNSHDLSLFFCLQFESLVHLLQDNWPECDIGSYDPVAIVRCQSHDFHQPCPQEAGVVGSQAVHVEPPSKLSSDAFLGLPDPQTVVAVHSETTPPLSDCAPINHDPFPTSGLSDIPDAQLEQLISPFAAASDSDFDPDYFDIESFIAA